MKKIIITVVALLLYLGTMAQETSDSLLIDSMKYSVTPGKYYLQYLQKNIGTKDDDEASEKSENTRLLDFWQDRMPAGTDKTNPFRKYAEALKKPHMGSCLPDDNMFNGNWKNTGPQFDNIQAQGIVYELWVDPTDDKKI
jgi:hypothetical protein